ncbi:conserved hypothetical protein [Neorickettsia risticii str. Illinois]|uniref:Uncharacterized protein n=1 Tax=Neorickettsia risticii (strain Illinois) TaxID=434131 RepID=C6V411_NEORI|nr:conserved hypothetical protein [Neorickettsia risticii str. Illinois]
MDLNLLNLEIGQCHCVPPEGESSIMICPCLIVKSDSDTEG